VLFSVNPLSTRLEHAEKWLEGDQRQENRGTLAIICRKINIADVKNKKYRSTSEILLK
jgi:hypothetical protein